MDNKLGRLLNKANNLRLPVDEKNIGKLMKLDATIFIVMDERGKFFAVSKLLETDTIIASKQWTAHVNMEEIDG
jgi:hypothetical protein